MKMDFEIPNIFQIDNSQQELIGLLLSPKQAGELIETMIKISQKSGTIMLALPARQLSQKERQEGLAFYPI